MSKYFVDTSLIDLGDGFKFKPITGSDELKWLKYYYVNGEPDIGLLQRCKLLNIEEVPFDKETLKEITGLDKPYCEYSYEDKFKVIDKINKELMQEIIQKINKIKSDDDEVKKN